MRYLLIADIHSNIVAFEAVLADARVRGGFDEAWCLGDIVGYGPWPNECIALLSSLPHKAIMGNHDCAAIGKMALSAFNALAAEACLWNGARLEERARAYLDALSTTLAGSPDVTMVHASLGDPLWEYMRDPEAAEATLGLSTTRHCLVGHSHLPLAFRWSDGQGTVVMQRLREGEPVSLHGARVVLNPGSVGQPRDGDARAAYGIYDADAGTVVLHRVAYAIGKVQREMERVGLPGPLAERLAHGW